MGQGLSKRSIAQRNRIALQKLENIEHVPDESPFVLDESSILEREEKRQVCLKTTERFGQEACTGRNWLGMIHMIYCMNHGCATLCSKNSNIESIPMNHWTLGDVSLTTLLL